MFSKPEEVIMACLAALWVVISYVLVRYTGANWSCVLMITGLTAIWATVSFLLWQTGRIEKLYPLLLGALVACWWPWLDWFAVRGVATTAQNDVLLITKPWYATWWFKMILSAIPIIIGYTKMWRSKQKPTF